MARRLEPGLRERPSPSPAAAHAASAAPRGGPAAASPAPDSEQVLRRALRLGHRPAALSLRSEAERVRRYSISKAPEDRTIYSVSDDGKMVTGMRTPNHVLLVDGESKVDSINRAILNSPLEVYAKARVRRFDRDFLSLGLRFERRRAADAPTGALSGEFLGSALKKFSRTPRTDLHALYQKAVVPGLRHLRTRILERQEGVVRQQADNYRELGTLTRGLVDHLELFKKVVISELASTGTWSDDLKEKAGVVRSFVVIVERVLDSATLRRADVERAVQDLLGLWFDEINDPPLNLVDETSQAVLRALQALRDAFPADAVLDMPTLRGTLFQVSQLESLASEDAVLLYRACDVTASTLLGNRVDVENKHRLKSYTSGEAGVGHYATRVVASGTDWVSLEGFAASEKDRAVSGLGDATFPNLDNTWQFIMQGSTAAASGDVRDLSAEDRYFELYTKLRYYLKGIYHEGRGEFSAARRADAGKEGYDPTVAKGASGALMNAQAWKVLAEGWESEDAMKEFGDLRELETRWSLDGADPAWAMQTYWSELIKKLQG